MLVSEDEIMVAKKIIIGLSSAILISAVALFVLLDKTITEAEKKENTQFVIICQNSHRKLNTSGFLKINVISLLKFCVLDWML